MVFKFENFQKLTLPLVFCDEYNVYVDMTIGIGKTTTLLIAMAEMVERMNDQTQVLMFAATMESTVAAYEKFAKITQFTEITSTVMHHGYTSSDYNAQVVIGTPLELLKAIKSKKISLHAMKFICLDDVDRTANFAVVKQMFRDLSHQCRFMMCGSTSSVHEIHKYLTVEIFKSPRFDVLSNKISHLFIKTNLWSGKVAVIENLAALVSGQIIIFLSVCYFHSISKTLISKKYHIF